MGWNDRIGSDALKKKKAMKSLIGGMSSFRMATFISVILVPIVSFMKPIMGVGSAITLLFQGLCLCQNWYGILSVLHR